VIQDGKKTVMETVPWTPPRGVMHTTYRLTYDAASGTAGVTVNEDLGKGAVAIGPMPRESALRCIRCKWKPSMPGFCTGFFRGFQWSN
jgi:hypothetical protein